MPSVDASWSGKCVDRLVQQELKEKIVQLGDISNNFCNEYFKLDIKSTIYDSDQILEDVLIPVYLLGENPVPAGSKVDGNGRYFTNNVRLYGLQFPLYDPRNYTPPFALRTGNKISFVFIHSDDASLDGQLVSVARTKPDELHPSGQLIIRSPVVDLRYYLEIWMMDFLGWVKHFYIPDMYYWLYGTYSGYANYTKYDPRDRQTCDEVFRSLLTSFSEDAKGFTECIEGFRKNKI